MAWEGPAGRPASARQACSDLPGHRQNPVSLSSQHQARRQPVTMPAVWRYEGTALSTQQKGKPSKKAFAGGLEVLDCRDSG